MHIRPWLLRTHRFLRYPRFTQLPLGVEIALILLIKIALLTVLAKTFFSESQAKKMHMPTAKVEKHLLAPAATTASSAATPFTSTTEVTHASN